MGKWASSSPLASPTYLREALRNWAVSQHFENAWAEDPVRWYSALEKAPIHVQITMVLLPLPKLTERHPCRQRGKASGICLQKDVKVLYLIRGRALKVDGLGC